MNSLPPKLPTRLILTAILWAALAGASVGLGNTESSMAAKFHQEAQPILKQYCYDCHGDGANKGKIAFDELTSDEELVNHDLWLRVLKNVRSGLMPPDKKPRPSADEQQKLEHWIKYTAFGIDPKNPDPGRVTVRRLNRTEYRNTIRDLMGYDFNAEVEFPPDDTGYGFDNVGDVLTISPMLLEKYLAAAQAIVADAVPVVSKAVQEQTIPGNQFQKPDAKTGAESLRVVPLSYYEPGTVSAAFSVRQTGSYRATLQIGARGGFEYDPGRCRVVLKLNGREVLRREFGWYDNKNFPLTIEEKWEPGEQRLTVELEPLVPKDKKLYSPEMRVVDLTLRGPLEKDLWVQPKNYSRFFPRPVPAKSADRRAYAREILGNFATKAFRRPVDAKTADRLAGLAEMVYSQPDKSFEIGVSHAIVAVLASPRFLFRLEESEGATKSKAKISSIDEYSLASRLSYFLWSTMPDDELMALAKHGELRKNLAPQVRRMLADPRSDKMVQNFTGQWLQARDVDGISINARVILVRDSGQEREMREEQAAFRARFLAGANRTSSTNSSTTNTPALASLGGTNQAKASGGTNGPGKFPTRKFGAPRIDLDRDLREAMRRETEMFFASVVHEDRPVTDLIESDYTYLNEKLARLYGMTNVVGPDMRRVSLAPDSPRGGILTLGSTLVVTSNPDRTSPVKRGLFVLDNVLGTPAPPPPPNIPALEVVERDLKDHEPTLREALQLHREKPLCNSCHARMDPIGLAFENFNAMGMWREKERKQTIETAGKLITGETFDSVRELKHILATQHRVDFYRCLTEKLMTYALGRGPEYYDVEAVDGIVERLNRENGRFSALLMGIVESTPFQKMRLQATATVSASNGESAPHDSQIQLARKDQKE